ncbi:hypothetical protein POSPLADRAFT_1181307 [Postia placenta MAD-698-R-SB12]|uniref:Uncharacterized protein n=1 Tax=Postia placenta MAD-698-R-SB12 TaxID=670580 RepID=A0A1X6N0E9_9APHY|nr:hypothetical protein POSPLADRAFT_1181307 [Postia placenta MAD-698-R-SB12]OSX62091.1 hypothetical protein POSPLADRAFT_1181307 [Postia placenta MAD-698-R-SB12]
MQPLYLNNLASETGPQAVLWREQAIQDGVYLNAIFYGIHACVFGACLYYYFFTRETREKQTSWWPVCFVVILFAMGTINLASNFRTNDEFFIFSVNTPGGPVAFSESAKARHIDTWANSAAIIAAFMADSLLLIRTFVVWERNVFVMVVPCLMYVASTVLSVLVVVQLALPDGSLWTGPAYKIDLAYWATSMSLSMLLTLLLVSRLFWLRRKLIKAMGKEHGGVYTSIAAMLVESALPYGIISAVYIILYGLQNPAQSLFLGPLVQVECIAPELITAHVFRGRAWSGATIARIGPQSTIHFATEQPTADSENSTEMPVSVPTSAIVFKRGPSSADLPHGSHSGDHVYVISG